MGCSWIIVQELADGERPTKCRWGVSAKRGVNATTSADLLELRHTQLELGQLILKEEVRSVGKSETLRVVSTVQAWLSLK